MAFAPSGYCVKEHSVGTAPHLSDGCVLGFVYYLRAPHLTEVKVYAPILGWF